MGSVLSALLAGTLFGAGLSISQMVDPDKVLGFLDLAGSWDPSLALVMAAALAVTAAGYRLAWRRERPLLAPRFELPTRRDLDARLLGGAVLFGLGWGIAGFCPGPALASIAGGEGSALVFVAALLVGAWAGRHVPPAGARRGGGVHDPAAAPSEAP
ncbi:MAG: YeeE/YedE family protein [Myxococcota bacterium]|nr:YeeE/YedE family protein [Myxococcota bacterium]